MTLCGDNPSSVCRDCPASLSCKPVFAKKHKYQVCDEVDRTFKGIVFRSGLESKCARLFDALGWKWAYELHKMNMVYNGEELIYWPDFVVDCHLGRIFIEVKGKLLPSAKKKLLAWVYSFDNQTPSQDKRLYIMTKPDLKELQPVRDYLKEHCKRLPAWFNKGLADHETVIKHKRKVVK